VVVGDGFEGLRIAIEPDVAHLRRWDEFEDPLDHAQTGAQDRYDRDLLAREHLGRGGADGRGHGRLGQLEVPGRLIGLEHRELFDEFAELLGTGPDVTQDRQLVLNQGMVHEHHVVGQGGLGHHSAPLVE